MSTVSVPPATFLSASTTPLGVTVGPVVLGPASALAVAPACWPVLAAAFFFACAACRWAFAAAFLAAFAAFLAVFAALRISRLLVFHESRAVIESPSRNRRPSMSTISPLSSDTRPVQS